MSKPKGSNKANLEKTRNHLIALARQEFAKHGFHAASTNHLIKIAGSSRGTLYHHFKDKKEVFRAIYDSMSQEIAERLEKFPYSTHNPIKNLIDGCTEYLRIFTEKDFAQIILIDGPNVLGLAYCQSQDRETAYKALKQAVAEISKNNTPDIMLTDFLSGALDTYALRIAASAERNSCFLEYSKHFRRLTLKIFQD